MCGLGFVGSGFMVEGSGCVVQGMGFRLYALVLMVQCRVFDEQV